MTNITAPLPSLADIRIAIIGLGYVGLPLAAEFGKKFPIVGFDLNVDRIAALEAGHDATGEVSDEGLKAAQHLTFCSQYQGISDCNVYIVAVPTPIDRHRQPDLTPLLRASETIGKVIKRGDIVIYESTVYPGATEEDCLPVIEKVSGLTFNKDFYAGYSPERINPGDKDRPLPSIMKVTSGSTPEVADLVDALYREIITAGTFRAQSIKVAEASKVVENTQRDVNIALINELSIIFSHLDIDTAAVLDAAATKWNFNRMSPGLVGGHCIGVDPYYLVHKATAAGHIPDIIRLARELNDGMARNAVTRLVKKMIQSGTQVNGGKVLLMGVTFKENCPDIRNTKVVDMIEHIEGYGLSVDIYDPWADAAEVKEEFGLSIFNQAPQESYEAVIIAVPHAQFIDAGVDGIRGMLKSGGILFDMKAVFEAEDSDLRL